MNGSTSDPPSQINEALIRVVMEAFYVRARADAELGPIFHGEVADWDAHLRRVVDYLSSLLLGSSRYRGAAVAVHARIADLEPYHFARWLERGWSLLKNRRLLLPGGAGGRPRSPASVSIPSA